MNQEVVVSRKRMGSTKQWLGYGIAGVIVIAALGMYLGGYLQFGKVDEQSNSATFVQRCSDSDRQAFYNEYNKVTPSAEELKAIVGRITSDAEYKKDPNCTYTSLFYQVNVARDKTLATELLADLESLGGQGINPDSKFGAVLQYSSLKAMIDNMVGPENIPDGIG